MALMALAVSDASHPLGSDVAAWVAHHEALKRDDTAWSALIYNGPQFVPGDEDEPPYVLECRTCRVCGSTLARVVSR